MISKYLLTAKFDKNIEITKIEFLSQKQTKLLPHNNIHTLVSTREIICEFICQSQIYGSQCHRYCVITCESQRQKA